MEPTEPMELMKLPQHKPKLKHKPRLSKRRCKGRKQWNKNKKCENSSKIRRGKRKIGLRRIRRERSKRKKKKRECDLNNNAKKMKVWCKLRCNKSKNKRGRGNIKSKWLHKNRPIWGSRNSNKKMILKWWCSKKRRTICNLQGLKEGVEPLSRKLEQCCNKKRKITLKMSSKMMAKRSKWTGLERVRRKQPVQPLIKIKIRKLPPLNYIRPQRKVQGVDLVSKILSSWRRLSRCFARAQILLASPLISSLMTSTRWTKSLSIGEKSLNPASSSLLNSKRSLRSYYSLCRINWLILRRRSRKNSRKLIALRAKSWAMISKYRHCFFQSFHPKIENMLFRNYTDTIFW